MFPRKVSQLDVPAAGSEPQSPCEVVVGDQPVRLCVCSAQPSMSWGDAADAVSAASKTLLVIVQFA